MRLATPISIRNLFSLVVMFNVSFISPHTWSMCLSNGDISGINGPITLGTPGCADASGDTASVLSGASIINAGGNGILGSGVAWTITTDGSISARVGIELQNGGSITNQAGGSIMTINQGIYTLGGGTPPITLINAGIISSSTNSGALLQGGATVTNLVGGLIEGAFVGIEISGPDDPSGPPPSGGPSTIDNAGTIRSTTGFNQGIIFGMGGSLLNRSTGLIDAGGDAVLFDAAGTVDNFGQIGTLSYSSTGIGLAQGGTVTNELGGSILAQSKGVSLDGSAGTINNYGLIKASLGRAINITAGGTVNNASSGVLEAYSRAVHIEGTTGVINNAGVITGNLANLGYNTIEMLATNSTVVTSGTINGNTQYFAPNGTFILNGGAVNGDIVFTGSHNTFLFNGGIMNGQVTMGPGGNQTLVLRNITNANIPNVSILNGGAGNDNQLTFINSQYIGGSELLNWETITLNTSTLTLTSNLTVGSSGPSAFTPTLTIKHSTLYAQSGLTTLISATNSNPVLVNNAGNMSVSSPSANHSLSILGNYVGQGGAISLNAVLNADNSPADQLIINGVNGGGSASGQTFIAVNNLGGAGAMTTGNGIVLVETLNNATTDPTAFSLYMPIRAGIFDYRLFRGGLNPNDPTTAQDWFLRSTQANGSPILGPELSVYSSIMPIAMDIGTLAVGTLHERVGEELNTLISQQASSNHETHGMWIRGLHQTFREHVANFTSPKAAGGISGVQLGLDLYRAHTIKNDFNLAGVYVAYVSAQPTVNGLVTNEAGTGNSITHTGFIHLNADIGGLYLTHYWHNGAYLNLIAAGNAYDGLAASTRASLGLRGKGADGSAELGYPMDITEQWRIEPQAQVNYEYIQLNDSSDSMSTVAFGHSQAWLGRAGARLKHTQYIQNHLVEPFIRANYWTVLQGNTNHLFFSENSGFITTAKHGWLQLGGGLTVHTTKTTYVYLYLDSMVNAGPSDQSMRGFDGGLGLKAMWL